jgi:hypothetical protein
MMQTQDFVVTHVQRGFPKMQENNPELSQQESKNKKPIEIPVVPADANLETFVILEEENEKLTKENVFLKKKVEVLQQQNLELIQEMENIKSDFNPNSNR